MFTLFRLIILNIIWLCMTITAFITVFGWTPLILIIVWGLIEMALFYTPLLGALHDKPKTPRGGCGCSDFETCLGREDCTRYTSQDGLSHG